MKGRSRRGVRGPGRLRRRWFGPVFVLVIAVMAAAFWWGAHPAGDRGRPAVHPDEGLPSPHGEQVTIDIFLTRYDPQTGAIRLVRRSRTGSAEQPADRLRLALETLMAGPTPAERNEGFGTEIPSGTRLRQLRLKDGTAFVDLTAAFEEGGGSTSVMARIAQVVYTATQFPELAHEVRFLVNGQAKEWLTGEGVLIDHPFSRAGTPDSF